MKIWKSFSAEHSAKLRIVGTFQETKDINSAKEAIEALTGEVMKQDVCSLLKASYTPEIEDVLKQKNLYCIGEEDLIHFTHAHNIDYSNTTITINTDELDIQGLIKIMINNGAKIEIYSKHDYPNG